MSEPPRSKSAIRFATVFFVACFLLIGYFLFLILRPFFAILIWASVLTVVFLPLFGEILRVVRGQRAVASFITCLLILLLIVLPVTFLGIRIVQQSIALYNSLQASMGSDGETRLEEFEKRPWVNWVLDQTSKRFGTKRLSLRATLEQVVSALSGFLVARSSTVLKGVGGLFFGFLLMFISMFFLFRDGPLIRNIIEASNPLPLAYEKEIIRNFQDVSYATFFGSLLTAVVQGGSGAMLFWALGIPSPLFWGAIISFVSLIPIVGAFLVWLPWSGYLLLIGDTERALILLGVGGLVISSIDNVLKPLIIQDRTKMHPLLVFLSVLGGMEAFGFLGVIVGPLVVALFISFLNFYRLEFRETLERKLAERPQSPAEQ